MSTGLVSLTIALALVSEIAPSLPAQSPAPTPTDVFLVAHQDDWQLFMGDVAYKAIRRGNNIVFIYLTAGDENRGADYWRTRERAALQSTRLAAKVSDTAAAASATGCGSVLVLTHSIQRCALANTVSYFMRLPDGRRDGSGFEHNAFQSLRKLRAKKISAIMTADSSGTYSDWNDLTATVQELVRRERVMGSPVTLHVNDPNAAINPRDHSDHRIAGLAGAELRKNPGWGVVYYVGYALAGRPDNRSLAQIREKTALFLVYDREMLIANRAWSTYSERPRFYSMCMLRTYARKIPRR
ncbi:MAG: PIG-L family deacetylase [Gemmatimonadota bacterium]|nr:PIG-L family deacetylase [Gemmatimonadota bacterium]